MENETNRTRGPIGIESPCSKRWLELDGGGLERWCDQCALHVVDGSAMTAAEARRRITMSEERVCMSLRLDASGRPIHAVDAKPRSMPAPVARLGAAALAGILAACGPDKEADPKEGGSPPSNTDGQPTLLDDAAMGEVMGEVICPDVLGLAYADPGQGGQGGHGRQGPGNTDDPPTPPGSPARSDG